MAAVAHASPADIRRLVVVRTSPAVAALPPKPVPAATYRRRRAVALLVVVTALAALGLVLQGLLAPFGGGPLTASERPGGPGAVYVVQPGDTFWDIARRLEPTEDPRPLVTRLVAEHGSSSLVAGERLHLPALG
jgi:nucleoid-associated protein YgaU